MVQNTHINSSFIDIGKHKIEYKSAGDNGHSVIFLNGFRMNFDNWNKVYPEVAKEHRVFLFNRLGVGQSSKAQTSQVGKVVIDEIHQLLSELRVPPPYVFVAHSLGGIFANLYARTYRDEVAGIIFVDTPHPMEIKEQKSIKPPMILQVVNNGLKIIERLFDKYKYSEDEYITETVAQIQGADSFPEIPIAIVTGTKKMPFVPARAFDIHREYQLKLLDLSPESKHYICPESGHFPQITEPEIVLSAVMDILNRIKPVQIQA